MTSPAAGPARRLAGIDATGTPPNVVHEQRRHGQLRAGGDRQRLDQRPPGRGSAAPQHRRDHEDADRRGDRQLEPDRPDQQRVDQHEAAHGERQVAERGSGPAGDERGGRERRHRRGPEHRRLAPGDEREEREHARG